MFLILPDVPLRSSSFELPDRYLLWSRARVYADRLELTGWMLTGRYYRQIPLDMIKEIGHNGHHLLLDLTNGERVVLLVEKPARWARAVRLHRKVYRSA